MTRKLQGQYKGNVGSIIGNIYLNPDRKSGKRYNKKIIEIRPGVLKDDYSDLLTKEIERFDTRIGTDVRLNLISEMRKNEDRTKGKQTSIMEGFVYLVKNDVFPGWIKAGMTIDYEERLNTYNSYTPTNNFQMLSVKWVTDRKMFETILLEELGKNAKISRGEWFKIDETEALRIFNS